MQLQSKGTGFILRYTGYRLQNERERVAHECLLISRNLGGTAEGISSFVPDLG